MKIRVNWSLILVLIITLSQIGTLYGKPRKKSNTSKIHTLEFSGALATGNHTPDLEKKFANDIVFGALINPALNGSPGAAFNTPWQNKTYGGALLGVEYKWNRLIVNYEMSQFISRPSFDSFANVGSSSATLIFSRKTNVKVKRSNQTLLGGWLIYQLRKKHKFYALGGLNTINVKSDYEVEGPGSLLGNLFHQNTFSHSTTSTGSGTGLVFGVDYRYQLSRKMGLSARMLFSPGLNGSWDYQQVSVNVPGGLEFQGENGNYKITALQFNLKLEYVVKPKLRVFATLYNETAQHTDSEVILMDDGALSSTANFATAFLLNYSGSSYQESLIGLNFGVTYQLNL